MGYTEFCVSYILRKLPNCRQSAQNLTQDNFKLSTLFYLNIFSFYLPHSYFNPSLILANKKLIKYQIPLDL